MAKNLQNSDFLTYFFLNWRAIKTIKAKKSKFYFHNFLGNIVVHQISERLNENWGSLFDLKKGWRTD